MAIGTYATGVVSQTGGTAGLKGYLKLRKGLRMHGTFKVGDKVTFFGVKGTLIDHDAVGYGSKARILIDDSDVILWDCEWIDIATGGTNHE